VGWLANHVREKKHGNVTYFNVNPAHQSDQYLRGSLQAVRVCRDPNAPGAYNFSLEEIYARAEQGAREGALEFPHRGWPAPGFAVRIFLEMIRGLKQRCPRRAH